MFPKYWGFKLKKKKKLFTKIKTLKRQFVCLFYKNMLKIKLINYIKYLYSYGHFKV